MSLNTNISEMAEAYKRIKEATGLTSAHVIAERFLNRESKLRKGKEQQVQTERKLEEKQQEKDRLESVLDEVIQTGYDTRFRWREFDELETRLGSKLKMLENRQDKIDKLMVRCLFPTALFKQF